MPELAEVETLAGQLNNALSGQTVSNLEVFSDRWLVSGSPALLAGQKIDSVARWGKRLRFSFHNEAQLVSGLGMTGSWLTASSSHSAVAVLECQGVKAYYVDPRRFGRAYIFPSAQQAQEVLGPKIGVDAALSLDVDQLQQALGSGRVTLKGALLDQSRLSGIGNYLADEICWSASLSPRLPLSSLSGSDWERLNSSRLEVIARALQSQGASFSDYRHLDGGQGSMQNQLRVYGRSGLPCLRCQAPIEKSVVAGRGTHSCPQCQALAGNSNTA
jgi:formamidopyrimidine-DNA glycosylase